MKKSYLIMLLMVSVSGLIFSQSITVLQPNGGAGQKLASGSQYVIKWNASGTTHAFKITLWRDGVLVGNIGEKNAGNGARNKNWTVGQLEDGTMVPVDTGYSIKVKEKTTSVADTSDNTFEITSRITFQFTPVTAVVIKPHSIEVTQPGSRVLALNSSIRILWRPKNLTNNVKITLWKDGALFGTIAENLAPGRISHEWTIGSTRLKTANPGTGFKVRVEEMNVSNIFGESSTFEIEAPRNIDLSGYISSEVESREFGKVARLTIKIRVNNFGGGSIARVPVQVRVRAAGESEGASGEKVKNAFLDNVTYRGHSYEYTLHFDFRLHENLFGDRRRLERIATLIIDPDDTLRDKQRMNNTSTRRFFF